MTCHIHNLVPAYVPHFGMIGVHKGCQPTCCMFRRMMKIHFNKLVVMGGLCKNPSAVLHFLVNLYDAKSEMHAVILFHMAN